MAAVGEAAVASTAHVRGDVGPGSEAITGSSGTIASPHTAHIGRGCSGSIARGGRSWGGAMGVFSHGRGRASGCDRLREARDPPPATSGPRQPLAWARYRDPERAPAGTNAKSFARAREDAPRALKSGQRVGLLQIRWTSSAQETAGDKQRLDQLTLQGGAAACPIAARRASRGGASQSVRVSQSFSSVRWPEQWTSSLAGRVPVGIGLDITAVA